MWLGHGVGVTLTIRESSAGSSGTHFSEGEAEAKGDSDPVAIPQIEAGLDPVLRDYTPCLPRGPGGLPLSVSGGLWRDGSPGPWGPPATLVPPQLAHCSVQCGGPPPAQDAEAAAVESQSLCDPPWLTGVSGPLGLPEALLSALHWVCSGPGLRGKTAYSWGPHPQAPTPGAPCSLLLPSHSAQTRGLL